MTPRKTSLPSLLLVCLLASLPWGPGGFQGVTAYAAGGEGARSSLQQPSLEPVISYAENQDASPPLREMTFLKQGRGEPNFISPGFILPRLPFPKVENAPKLDLQPADPLVQLQSGASLARSLMPSPRFSFDGVSNRNGVLPPDPNGDIGPDHYVQWVNLSLAIWRIDRATQTATLVYGPVSGNILWAGFGGACEFTNHGDPIVLYDHLAGRWFISQFSVTGPFYQCIAVSQTSDPTGGWYRYAFKMSDTRMNDYPHFGVWPDGYYLTTNQFISTLWAGSESIVFERDKMLAGLPARMVSFDLYAVNSDFGGMLPADLDGPPPPPGTPNIFAEVDDSTWIPAVDALRLWEFHVDWADPARSTFGLSGNPNSVLPVANFTPLCPSVFPCIPQPVTTIRLDAIPDRLMHRLQYRYFGGYATLVANHTVDAGGGKAGIRWYELRSQSGSWSILQQGTYAGDSPNPNHRWMGSAAMDKMGDIAIGYSTAGTALYPSIAYTGRMAGDELGTLGQGEVTLTAGSGSQTSSTGRWGDYSMLSVDPVDDCTFWYTSEYYSLTSSSAWKTRIGAFALPSCLAQLTGKLQGRVTDAGSGLPLADTLVQVDSQSTRTDPNGVYQFFNLPAGVHTITVTAYGFRTLASQSVEIGAYATTTLDFALIRRSNVRVNGVVKDGSGQGWPLYARLEIRAPGLDSDVFSSPLTGAYQIDLAEGVAHTITVSANISGYQPLTTVITPTLEMTAQDFTLVVDSSACTAPGYASTGACAPMQGGILTGNVYDGNSGAGVNGADLKVEGEKSSTLATPNDPGLEDGFYNFFSPVTGPIQITASKEGYSSQTHSLDLTPGSVVQEDFTLPAGRLRASLPGLAVTLSTLRPNTYLLDLANSGTLTATFAIAEVDAPVPALRADGPFAESTRHISPKHLHDLTSSSVYEYNPPAASKLPAGEVIQSWQTGLAAPWGIGFNPNAGDLWISSASAGGGDDRDHRFTTGGESLPEIVEFSSTPSAFAADMAFDSRSNTFWQILVGGSNCLVEIDPSESALTGRSLCPGFDNSQRGLAYNPLEDSFYSGSWSSGILYHFDNSGRILDSTSTGLNIAGLAFNPATRRLFVLSNASKGFDVYVLDAAHGYALLGGFDIPGLDAYQQAGLEMDCEGHLWAVNQGNGFLIEANSGDLAACAWSDIPWLRVSPASGILPPGGVQQIQVIIGPAPDSFQAKDAHLSINSDTPYGSILLPVHPVPMFETALPLIFRK